MAGHSRKLVAVGFGTAAAVVTLMTAGSGIAAADAFTDPSGGTPDGGVRVPAIQGVPGASDGLVSAQVGPCNVAPCIRSSPRFEPPSPAYAWWGGGPTMEDKSAVTAGQHHPNWLGPIHPYN